MWRKIHDPTRHPTPLTPHPQVPVDEFSFRPPEQLKQYKRSLILPVISYSSRQADLSQTETEELCFDASIPKFSSTLYPFFDVMYFPCRPFYFWEKNYGIYSHINFAKSHFSSLSLYFAEVCEYVKPVFTGLCFCGSNKMEEKEKKETRQSQIFQSLKTDQKSLNKFKLDSKHVLAFNFLISSEPLPQPQQHSESPQPPSPPPKKNKFKIF
jgi:hypothetical protein